ncbi:hypothetical protein BCR35DRAFT_315593, partial [Leucosporidium creatinivorum]
FDDNLEAFKSLLQVTSRLCTTLRGDYKLLPSWKRWNKFCKVVLYSSESTGAAGEHDRGDYDSVPLARAMLRGSFSDSSQASTAPIVPSKLSHVHSANAPSSDHRRLSFDSARSISPEWENSIPYPGIPLLEWIARQDAKEEAARGGAEGSVEEEDEGGAIDPSLDRRSPGTPTVEDALVYFSKPETPSARPSITLSASSAAVYGQPGSPSSHSPETGPSYSATGRLYHPPSTKPFKCPTEGCDKTYKQQNGLKYHLKHGKCSNDPEAAKEDDPLTVDKKRFACHQIVDCGKRYKNYNGLRYHYEHSGAHGMVGLQLLRQGHHPPWGPKTTSEDVASVKEQENEHEQEDEYEHEEKEEGEA